VLPTLPLAGRKCYLLPLHKKERHWFIHSITTHQSRLLTMLADVNPAESPGGERFDNRDRVSDNSYYDGVLAWCDAFDIDFCGVNNEFDSRDDIFPSVEQNNAILASKSFVESILTAVSREFDGNGITEASTKTIRGSISHLPSTIR